MNKPIPGTVRVVENGVIIGRAVVDPTAFQDYYEQHYDMDQIRLAWSIRYRAQMLSDHVPNLKKDQKSQP